MAFTAARTPAISTPVRRFPLLIVLAPLLVCGCSRFESDWRTPALRNVPSGDPLEGRWKGNWKSTPSGHSGSLRCIMTRVDDDTYRARFNASWALLLRFEYAVDMQVERRDGVAYFKGAADLGKAMKSLGVYHYDGHADGRVFHSTYKSPKDQGYFQMKRP